MYWLNLVVSRCFKVFQHLPVYRFLRLFSCLLYRGYQEPCFTCPTSFNSANICLQLHAAKASKNRSKLTSYHPMFTFAWHLSQIVINFFVGSINTYRRYYFVGHRIYWIIFHDQITFVIKSPYFWWVVYISYSLHLLWL